MRTPDFIHVRARQQPRLAKQIGRVAATLAVVAAATQPFPRAADVTDSTATAIQPGRPNVVLIITDDQDVESVNYMVRLKALMTDQGTTFTNMFIPSPQCCPSHVSFLTGRYPHNTGVLNNWYPTGGFERFRELRGITRRLPRGCSRRVIVPRASVST